MNILFLDQFAEPGGAQLCLLDILAVAVKAGHRAHVALPGPGPVASRIRALGITVDRITCGPFASGKKTVADRLRFVWQFPTLAGEISRMIDRRAIDLVYVNGPRLVPAACVAARRSASLLFHSHNRLARSQAKLVSRSIRLPRRARIVAASQFVAEDYRSLPSGTVSVVYNGVGPQRFHRPDHAGRMRAGVIGRIAPEKGQGIFLEAIARSPELQEHSFLVCGDALFGDSTALRYRQSVNAAATRLPVEFIGWQDDIGVVLSRLDLLVVPSLAVESTTRVALEAYAAGVPVLAFRHGGLPEVIEDGVTGFLVDEPTPAALADAMTALLRSPHMLRKAGRRAHLVWRNRFTAERFQEQILSVIESLR
jgi:glycosyltransferase involved in cell wall biosynthesis